MKTSTYPWAGKHGPLMIAEIGGNHEGNFDYAMRLAELALESDVDIVKFQVYTGDTLVSKIEGAARNEHFKKFELTRAEYVQLAELVESRGRMFMASVWSIDMIDFLDAHMPIYKIGSGDMTAYPLLRAFAERGKPMIVSTGLALTAEVQSAVRYVRGVNSVYNDRAALALLQCTSMYPIPAQDANLAVMQTLREMTGAAIGYSDHTVGGHALEIAYAMGAEILEFHFTDSRDGKVFRDHKVSLTVDEVHELQQRLALITRLRGSPVKQPLEIEGEHVVSFRRAVYPSRDIAAGEVLTEENLTVLRPNHGIDAREFDLLLGQTLNTSVARHQKLSWDMLDTQANQ